MVVLLYTILTLSVIGVLMAVLLYFVAKKFRVIEDPRIDSVEAMLPGVNCGGCGYAGCRAFAGEIVLHPDIQHMYCPVGGAEVMDRIADFIGKSVAAQGARVAVVRCAGSHAVRPTTNNYDGAASCAVAAALYGGETGCSFGCLGHGDCARACEFDALHMDAETGLPVVDETKCTACGACVTACPKAIIELRFKGPQGKRICVMCVNKDRGGVAVKSCKVACIGCGKCVKACAYDAIVLADNLAYIDPKKCTLCRECVAVCPTGAIIETGFPPRGTTVN